jgi:hypothetical protein
VEDWRYENLREDMKRLREDLQEVRGRTYSVETWQSLFPLRVLMVILWLIAIGIWVSGIAEAIARSQ